MGERAGGGAMGGWVDGSCATIILTLLMSKLRPRETK